MIKFFFFTFTVITLFFTGCASKLPNKSFNASANIDIKKIAIVRPPIQDDYEIYYHNHPGMNFGLIGGLAAAAEFKSKTSSYNSALGDSKFDASEYFIDSIKKEFENSKYKVTILDAPRSSDVAYKKSYEESDCDAYLDCFMPVVGYVAGSSSSVYKPTVKLFSKLVKNGSNEVLYEKLIVSGESTNVPEDADYLKYDTTHTYESFSSLESNATDSIEGLKIALDTISKRLVSSLADSE